MHRAPACSRNVNELACKPARGQIEKGRVIRLCRMGPFHSSLCQSLDSRSFGTYLTSVPIWLTGSSHGALIPLMAVLTTAGVRQRARAPRPADVSPVQPILGKSDPFAAVVAERKFSL